LSYFWCGFCPAGGRGRKNRLQKANAFVIYMLGEFVETCEAKQVQIDQTKTQLQLFASCVCSFSFVNTLGITVFSNDPLFGVQFCILYFCEF
jgi:hypothetical protein